MSAFGFALFRTALGCLAVAWFITLIPDLGTFFGQQGLSPPSVSSRGGISVIRPFGSDVALIVAVGAGLMASTLLVVGRRTRVAGPVVALVVTSLMNDNALLWNSGDELFQTVLVLFASYCILTPSTDLDRSVLASYRDGGDLAVGRIWLFQLVRIQLTLVYLVAFLAKIGGTPWRDGTAAMMVFRLETLERFAVPGPLLTNEPLSNLVTWSTLAIEGLVPVLLWSRRTRPHMVGAAIALHLAIDWALSIGLFSWIMIVCHITFLPATLKIRRPRSRPIPVTRTAT